MRFNERLAHASDQARALPDGEALAADLMRLARDIDDHLAENTKERYGKLRDALAAWNTFLNASVDEAYGESKQKIEIERRHIARAIAGDPRWSGGYADALAVVEAEITP